MNQGVARANNTLVIPNSSDANGAIRNFASQGTKGLVLSGAKVFSLVLLIFFIGYIVCTFFNLFFNKKEEESKEENKGENKEKIETLSDDFMDIFCKTEKEEKESRMLSPRIEFRKNDNGMNILLCLICKLHKKCERKVNTKVRVKKDKMVDLCAFWGCGSGKKFRDFCKNNGNNEIKLGLVESDETQTSNGLKLDFCYFPGGGKPVTNKFTAMIKNDMNSLFTLYNFFFGEEPIVVNKSGTKVKIERKEGFFTVTRYDGDSKTLVFTFDPKKNYVNFNVIWKALLADKKEPLGKDAFYVDKDLDKDSNSLPVNLISGKNKESDHLLRDLEYDIRVLYEGKISIPRKLKLKAKNFKAFLSYGQVKDNKLREKISNNIDFISSLDENMLLDVECKKIDDEAVA